MTAAPTIIATVAGVLLFTFLLGFLLLGLFTWWEKHDLDPIAAVIDWACGFWEKRL